MIGYRRVIPRDLFNEGNLLKCYGQLYIELERMRLEHLLVQRSEAGPFVIQQSQDDGSLSITNVTLIAHGRPCLLYRPLNSRAPYPLWLLSPDGATDDVCVFKDDGSFTDEMRDFLTREDDDDGEDED